MQRSNPHYAVIVARLAAAVVLTACAGDDGASTSEGASADASGAGTFGVSSTSAASSATGGDSSSSTSTSSSTGAGGDGDGDGESDSDSEGDAAIEELCQRYEDNYAECYPGVEYAFEYCMGFFELRAVDGEECLAAAEDFYVCLSELSCEEWKTTDEFCPELVPPLLDACPSFQP